MNAPTVIKSHMSITGTEFVAMHHFDCGHSVPVYDVATCHALNQILGHVKYNNRSYGNVYYRGECRLHSSLLPSIMRERRSPHDHANKPHRLNPHKRTSVISGLLRKICADEYLQETFRTLTTVNKQHILEGLLQHYGIPTRYVDLVDNHWVALWMGLHRCQKINGYTHYVRREIPLPADKAQDDLYQYVLLLAFPYAESTQHDGVRLSADFVEVDLRQASPSFFIRPHAQHAIMVKRKPATLRDCSDYDLAQQVCAIFRIRVYRAAQWIGQGEMLSQDYMFPATAYDQGYERLLLRTDLFDKDGYKILRYV